VHQPLRHDRSQTICLRWIPVSSDAPHQLDSPTGKCCLSKQMSVPLTSCNCNWRSRKAREYLKVNNIESSPLLPLPSGKTVTRSAGQSPAVEGSLAARGSEYSLKMPAGNSVLDSWEVLDIHRPFIWLQLANSDFN